MAKAQRRDGLVSLEDLIALPKEDEHLLELVQGMVVREPRPGAIHASVLTRLVFALHSHVSRRGDGVVLTEAGFRLAEQPPTVRGPDVAFVSTGRLPKEPDAKGFWPFAPDLAVEVLSPSNRASEMQQKVLEYFEAGARLVWIVDPRLRTVMVHRSAREAVILTGEGVLEGGEVLPGLRIDLSQLFDLWS